MKFKSLFIVLSTVVFAGCTSTPKRNPLPEELASKAIIPGIPYARHWADESTAWKRSSTAEIQAAHKGIMNKPHHYLAISGGGSNGAFGAGILTGWTETGKRPEFTMVTGISTGSILAPFAFLGSDYDATIIDLFCNHPTHDVLNTRNIIKGWRLGALTDNAPLRALLLEKITDVEVERIAEEHRKGRRLLIGTFNLDAGRSTSWNIGEIATSKHPNRNELIVDIIVASASIPVAFPPKAIDVEANGEIYQELHADGGLGSQVYLYPPQLHWDEYKEILQIQGIPEIYVIRNAKLTPAWATVETSLISLASRSLSSLIRTQGIGDLYRIYFSTQRDGLCFKLAYIPSDFTAQSDETFDIEYMKALFERGHNLITSEHPWIEKLD